MAKTRVDRERLDGKLGGHDVAVVALGEGQEEVCALGARAPQGVLVRPVATDGAAPEGGGQAVEGTGDEIDDGDLVAGGIQRPRHRGADATAADDDGSHARCSSGIASRATQTAHGAFFRT